MSNTNRQIVLASRPKGEVTPDNFRLVEAALAPLADGQGWRLGAAPEMVENQAAAEPTIAPPLPEWINRPVGARPPAAAEPPPPRRAAAKVDRGILIHRILQNLPDLGEAERLPYIEAAVKRAGADPSLAAELQDLIASPVLEGLLSADGHSEAALITEAPGGGIDRRRIDRLVILPDAILVADYKTDRVVPARAEDCDPAYLMQLAIYRDALRLTEPGKPLRFCIVWTEVPRLMPIPDTLLDRMAALRQSRP